MRSSPEAKVLGFKRRNVQKSGQAGRELELELGEDGLLPERRRRRRRSAGWRVRLWKHRGKGAGLDWTGEMLTSREVVDESGGA